MVLVTHEAALAKSAERLIVMRDGAIESDRVGDCG